MTPGAGHLAPPRWVEPVAAWLRWGALAFSAVLILAGERPVGAPWLAATGGLLVALALAAGYVGRGGRVPSTGWLVAETAVATFAVVLSGGWASPFGLYLAVPVLVATLRLGGVAVLLPVGAVLAVGGAEAAVGQGLPAAGESLPLLLPLLVTTTLGLVGHRWGGTPPAAGGGAPVLGGVEELGHVNALLSSLHRLVRSTSAPLSVEDVFSAVQRELEEMFDPDAIVLLLEDADGRWWRSADVPGATNVGEVAYADLPADLLHAGSTGEPVLVPRLGQGGGLTPAARAGVYQWLFSRGRRSALLALERDEPGEVPAPYLDSLERLATPLALALDNAVWFRRLRTLGAEDERQRLGTQLHDRFAQSLAYVGLELDRAAARHRDDEQLAAVRDDVRATLAEMRATLRDLRRRCTEARGLAGTLTEEVAAYDERFGATAELDVTPGFPRLPLPVENHLLRAVQELLALAQRSGAGEIVVRLVADDERVRVVVRDDGRGTEASEPERERADVLSGVRDRADAIGARVDVRSREEEGTEVALTLRRT